MQDLDFRTGTINPIECLREGWAVVKPRYWSLLGLTILGAIVAGATLYVLLGAMACGIMLSYLKVIDGEEIKIDVLFRGFTYFRPGLLVALCIVVPMIVVYAVVYLPLLIATINGQRMSEDELFTMLISAGTVDLVFIILMVCFHTLLLFAFPLIVDRDLGALASIKTSAKAVWKNLGGISGLIGVNFLLTLAGALVFCVGIYLTIPLILASNLVAYRKVFPKADPPNFYPPPPEAYQGLN